MVKEKNKYEDTSNSLIRKKAATQELHITLFGM